MQARARQAVWVAGGLLAVLVTAWSHALQFDDDPLMAIAYSLIGLGWFGTAWLLWEQDEQRSNARLFLLVSAVWMIGECARRDIGWLYPPALFVSQFTQVLASGLLLRYPRTSFDRPARVYLVGGVLLTTVIGLGAVLTAPGPGRPDDASGVVLDAVGPFGFADFQQAKGLFWAVWAVAFLVLSVRRWRRLALFERRTLAPIIGVGALCALTIGSAAFETSLPPELQRALRLARGLSGVAVSLAFLASALRLRMVRGSVADLVGRLSGPVGVEEVRAALVGALGDDDLHVVPYSPGAERAPAVDGRFVLPVPGSDGRPLALATFAPEMRRHAGLLESHLSVCGLALENSRLTDDLSAQLEAVQDARARLVQAAIDERRRLERDLHDGAQQRLLALGLRLGAVEARVPDPATAQAIRGLKDELHVALAELRDLAHGIHPAVLTQAGLGPALESVVERLPVPVTLTVPARRRPADVESAAYLVACEAVANAVKHAGPCTIRVAVKDEPDRLVLVVEDDGRGFDAAAAPGGRPVLRTVGDRLTALGGTVVVESSPGHGTTVRAHLPVADGGAIPSGTPDP